MDAPNPILARVTRGATVEAVHRGAVAVMRGGQVVYAAGDVEALQCMRSTAKPFQALTALEIMRGAGFEVSDAEIAVISASHGGQPLHVGLVRGLLARAGIPESQLQCGAHVPMHAHSAAALVRAGEEPSALHNNCSGKHAAMLIATRILGAPLDDYLGIEGPLQQRNRATVARFAEVGPEEVGVTVDGCSAPTFVLPLSRMARAYSNLMDLGVDVSVPVRKRWLAAIAGEPVAYAGEGRTCTRLIQITRGGLYPKIGAEGVYTLGIPGQGLGIATKIDDGSHRATEALIVSLILRHRPGWQDEVLAELRRMREAPIKNHRGLVVGEMEVALP